MKARIVGLLTGLLVCGATAVSADPVTSTTITFENSPCMVQSTGAVPSNCYGTLGIYLSAFSPSVSGGINDTSVFSIHSAADAVSRPNVASGFSTAAPGVGGPFPDLRGVVVAPGSVNATGWTDMLSFNVVGSPGGSAPWTVEFFGGEDQGTLLQTFSGTTDQRVSFALPEPNIHSFELFSGSSSQGIDNLTFDTATTPEPASVLLFGSGVMGLLYRRRRAN